MDFVLSNIWFKFNRKQLDKDLTNITFTPQTNSNRTVTLKELSSSTQLSEVANDNTKTKYKFLSNKQDALILLINLGGAVYWQ